MKTLAGFLASLAIACSAQAGTDTVIHFTNFSPFSAKVDFAAGDGDCWHDRYTSRTAEYLVTYARGYVWPEHLKDFLDAYQEATGIRDFGLVPSHDMAGTTHTLRPAVTGAKVSSVVFAGETSAELFAGCKFATSKRAFTVQLSDDAGRTLSTQRYLLEDPPSSDWRLSRMRSDNRNAADQTIGLGSGGTFLVSKAFPASLNITHVPLGPASTDIVALIKRYQIWLGAAEQKALGTALAGIFPAEGRRGVVKEWLQRAFAFVFDGGARSAEAGDVASFSAGVDSTLDAPTYYAAQVFGSYTMYARNPNGAPQRVPDGTRLSADQLGVDFGNPMLLSNVTMSGSDQSICVYATNTIVLSECRTVGISLTIMPNGSLVFLPMPYAGGSPP